jgi:pSer/pThr/pTyr-binding forkhead associated (FHA) protein
MDETIRGESNLGQRLGKLPKSESSFLVFKGKSIPVVARITMGRAESNHIVIDDTLASRNHAIIQKIKNEYFIKDLNSTNGTYVNDEMVPKDKYIKLKVNDTIKIGRTELTFK